MLFSGAQFSPRYLVLFVLWLLLFPVFLRFCYCACFDRRWSEFFFTGVCFQSRVTRDVLFVLVLSTGLNWASFLLVLTPVLSGILFLSLNLSPGLSGSQFFGACFQCRFFWESFPGLVFDPVSLKFFEVFTSSPGLLETPCFACF